MGRVFKIVFALLLLLIIVFLTFGSIIYMYGIGAKPEKSDCIIVLGCQVYGTVPSALLKARLDEGLRLFNEGYGRIIIVSGGKGLGEDISEAQAMKDYLVSKGMDSSKIIMEDKATSTYENIVLSKERMEDRGLRSAVIVSNKFHLRRTSLIAQKEEVTASCSGVFASGYLGYEIKGFLREILALMKYYITGR